MAADCADLTDQWDTAFEVDNEERLIQLICVIRAIRGQESPTSFPVAWLEEAEAAG